MHAKAVARRSLALSAVIFSLWQANAHSVSQAAPVESNSPQLKVSLGNALAPMHRRHLALYEKAPTGCPTPYGPVVCGPDSAVYILNTARSTAIYVFDQQHRGDVRIMIHQKIVNASPGEEIVLSKLPDEPFEKLNPAWGISTRGPHREERVGDVRVFKVEFRPEDAYRNIPEIVALANSSDPIKQNILTRLLKGAAILRKA